MQKSFGECLEFMNAVRDNLRNDFIICASCVCVSDAVRVCNPVNVRAFQIPQVLFAWQAIFYPQKRSVISVDSAKNFGMGLAVGACRITL